MMRYLCLFPVIIAFSCTKAKVPVPVKPDSKVHYQTTVKRFINANCINCHDTGSSFPMDTRQKVIAVMNSGQFLGALKTPIGQESPYLHMPPYYVIQQADLDSLQNWKQEDYPD
ncbi:hypothetical protein [Fluviicola sp.]|uniref:hypothetical protein n=1 Tax=Fluviicola sp. TaxID=1917219 RepID=UPI0031DFAFF3